MLDTRNTFLESLSQTLGNMGSENRSHALAFLLNLATSYTPAFMIQIFNIRELSESIFTSVLHRDFITTLAFNFYSRFPDNIDDEYMTLVRKLSFAITLYSGNNADGLEIDKEVSSRLPSSESVIKTLKENRWLVVILVAILYVNVDEIRKGIKVAE